MAGAGSVFAASNTHFSVVGKIQSINNAKARVKIDGHVFAVVPSVMGALHKVGDTAQVTLHLNPQGKVIGVTRMAHIVHRPTGPVTAISSTSITVGTTVYPLMPGALIHYHDFILTTATVPLNSLAAVDLNSAGTVTAVWLSTDPNLPQSPTISGLLTAVTSTSITLNGYTLTVIPNVLVRAGNQSVPYGNVIVNDRAMVRLDQQGVVDFIQLQPQGAAQGTVTADTASTITVGTTVYSYAPTVTIRYNGYTLTPTQIPVGSLAVVQRNAMNQVTAVTLKNDANLPRAHQVSGTISTVSGNTLDLAGYTLTMAPNFNIAYDGVSSLSNSVAVGETAHASLNASGQVTQLTIGTPAQH